MSLLGKSKGYTPDEIAHYIARIETLDRLRDKALQAHRLLKDQRYKDEYDRYCENIRIAQIVLQKILTKVHKS